MTTLNLMKKHSVTKLKSITSKIDFVMFYFRFSKYSMTSLWFCSLAKSSGVLPELAFGKASNFNSSTNNWQTSRCPWKAALCKGNHPFLYFAFIFWNFCRTNLISGNAPFPASRDYFFEWMNFFNLFWNNQGKEHF